MRLRIAELLAHGRSLVAQIGELRLGAATWALARATFAWASASTRARSAAAAEAVSSA